MTMTDVEAQELVFTRCELEGLLGARQFVSFNVREQRRYDQLASRESELLALLGR